MTYVSLDDMRSYSMALRNNGHNATGVDRAVKVIGHYLETAYPHAGARLSRVNLFTIDVTGVARANHPGVHRKEDLEVAAKDFLQALTLRSSQRLARFIDHQYRSRLPANEAELIPSRSPGRPVAPAEASTTKVERPAFRLKGTHPTGQELFDYLNLDFVPASVTKLRPTQLTRMKNAAVKAMEATFGSHWRTTVLDEVAVDRVMTSTGTTRTHASHVKAFADAVALLEAGLKAPTAERPPASGEIAL